MPWRMTPKRLIARRPAIAREGCAIVALMDDYQQRPALGWHCFLMTPVITASIATESRFGARLIWTNTAT